jgi:hypothetical protein
MEKYYFYWLSIRDGYYSEQRKKVMVKFATLISNRQTADGALLRAILDETLEDEQFRVSDKLLKEFVARVVEYSYQIPTRHFR